MDGQVGSLQASEGAGQRRDLDFFSALGGIRTPNLLIRSQMLYPLSYERRRDGRSYLAAQAGGEAPGQARLTRIRDVESAASADRRIAMTSPGPSAESSHSPRVSGRRVEVDVATGGSRLLAVDDARTCARGHAGRSQFGDALW